MTTESSNWEIKHLGYAFAIADDLIDYHSNLVSQEILNLIKQHVRDSEFNNIDIVGAYRFPKEIYFSGVQRLASGIFYEFWAERRPRPAKLQKLEAQLTEILRHHAIQNLVELAETLLEDYDDLDLIDQRYLSNAEAETLRIFVKTTKDISN